MWGNKILSRPVNTHVFPYLICLYVRAPLSVVMYMFIWTRRQVHLHTEARDPHPAPSSITSPAYLGHGSHWAGAQWVMRLCTLESLLSLLPPLVAGLTNSWFFTWASLCGRYCTNRATSPASSHLLLRQGLINVAQAGLQLVNCLASASRMLDKDIHHHAQSSAQHHFISTSSWASDLRNHSWSVTVATKTAAISTAEKQNPPNTNMLK